MITTKMNIPFVNLKANYESIKPEIDSAIKEVLDTTAFIMGKHVTDFDRNFANFLGSKFAYGVSNGTHALHLILEALKIQQGDEVITAANSFIATPEAILYTKATPVFVDVNEETNNIDPEKIEQAITKKTKAIIPVHLYGHPAEMDKINNLAKKHNLHVIEDACQAHGAKYKDKTTGTLGDAAAFSMYPAKILGAFGDAGGVSTNNEELAKLLFKLRDHGRIDKYKHDLTGFNYRIHALQAAILNAKLPHLNKWIEQRRNIAKIYNEQLSQTVITPKEAEWAKHSYYMYVIRSKNRDKLRENLKEAGISTGIHFPIPLHLQPSLKFLGYKEDDFPITEKLAKEIVSIPMYPDLTEEQQSYVIEKIKEFEK